ncbi:ComF family protein [Streptomyces sp. CB02414]|uniref:ComF family protein n=1 Tax=Streptomyces sp. CB02414 TaxID=1703922 RepID=UPI00093F2496|nr:ComF family protein [Streptomyces sp. CB02414]OKI90744.1 competence protein F phosphoribosyltransferase [Streptomyces sp. CB02414]
MREWWRDLTDLVLPAECGGCGRARSVLCPRCRTALSGAAPGRVRPVPEPPGLPVVHAAARYADEVRAALLAHKERGVLALSAPLGVALAGAVRAAVRARGPVLLVPVPSARRAVRTRGHDPARRIALAAARELRRTGTPARVLPVLRQRHAVADQSGLGARQRLDNLAGALAVVPGGGRLLCGGGPVVLVDDLMTTGASLTEAARALRAATAGKGPCVSEWTTGPGTYWTAKSAVYPAAAGEGREERKAGPRMAGPNGGGGVIGEVICAAVVAASPDSFELNRN